MSPWERLLEKPHTRGHFVQVCQPDEKSLLTNVALYFSEGLKRGEGALAITTPLHQEVFIRELGRSGVDTASAIRDRRLICLDAEETLSQFMVAGRPDWTKFETTITKAMGAIQGQEDQSGPRLYGDMVGVLWSQRQFAAAVQLERFWNKLLARSSFSLYCAYSIDVFGKDFRVPPLEGVLRAHTHLMPCESDGNLEAAIDSAMDETLGANANSIRQLIQSNDRSSWAVMPKAETTILWLRKNLPDEAAQIIERAREIYQQSHPATAAASQPI